MQNRQIVCLTLADRYPNTYPLGCIMEKFFPPECCYENVVMRMFFFPTGMLLWECCYGNVVMEMLSWKC